MISFKGWHLWSLAVFAALATLALRAELSARHDFAEAERARVSGDVSRAIRHYQYALHWRTPLSNTEERAAEALLAIADDARVKADRKTELKALRRLRGGILAIRSLGTPMSNRLSLANTRLARVTAEEQISLGGPTIDGRSQEALEAHHLSLLNLDPSPHVGWSLVVVFAFLSWVGLVFLIITRGLDAELRILQPFFGRALAGFVFIFGLWLFALTHA